MERIVQWAFEPGMRALEERLPTPDQVEAYRRSIQESPTGQNRR